MLSAQTAIEREKIKESLDNLSRALRNMDITEETLDSLSQGFPEEFRAETKTVLFLDRERLLKEKDYLETKDRLLKAKERMQKIEEEKRKREEELKKRSETESQTASGTQLMTPERLLKRLDEMFGLPKVDRKIPELRSSSLEFLSIESEVSRNPERMKDMSDFLIFKDFNNDLHAVRVSCIFYAIGSYEKENNLVYSNFFINSISNEKFIELSRSDGASYSENDMASFVKFSDNESFARFVVKFPYTNKFYECLLK